MVEVIYNFHTSLKCKRTTATTEPVMSEMIFMICPSYVSLQDQGLYVEWRVERRVEDLTQC